MKNLSLTFCLGIAALFGGVGGVFARTILFLTMLILPVLCYAESDNYEFAWEDVFACSTKIFKSVNDLDTATSLSSYIIHTSKTDNHYVVFTHGNEYPSFRKHRSTELYVQSGGIRWLEIEDMSGGVTKFTLYLKKNNEIYTANLNFDKSSLAAVVKKSWADKSELLICWDYLKNK
jgi:hypothetical protein